MQYETVRPNIKTGDVLAWSSDTFLGKLVRSMTESTYSHLGLAVILRDRVFVLEAVHPLVRLVPLSSLLPAYVVHMNSPLSQEAEDYAFSLVGTKHYSFIDAVKGMFTSKVDTEDFQCAELVKALLEKNGTKIASINTPSDVIRVLEKHDKTPIYME